MGSEEGEKASRSSRYGRKGGGVVNYTVNRRETEQQDECDACVRMGKGVPPTVTDGPPCHTLNSRPIRNTKDVTNRDPCCRAYMALPAPQGLYTACSTWAQPLTSTARVTCTSHAKRTTHA